MVGTAGTAVGMDVSSSIDIAIEAAAVTSLRLGRP